MASLVYLLGTVVTLLCAILLLRAYHRVRMNLLLWSGLCFVGLTASNALLYIDLILLPETTNLYMARLATAAGAMLLLIYGLVFESE